MSIADGQALKLFEEARDDGVITHKEGEHLAQRLTLEDWQSLSNTQTDENRLYGVKGGLFVEEKENEFIIHNNEMDVRSKDIFTGLKSLAWGVGGTVGGFVGYKALGRYVLSGGSPYAKLVAAGIGILTGVAHNKIAGAGIDELKANPDIHIPKSGLAAAITSSALDSEQNRQLAYARNSRAYSLEGLRLRS